MKSDELLKALTDSGHPRTHFVVQGSHKLRHQLHDIVLADSTGHQLHDIVLADSTVVSKRLGGKAWSNYLSPGPQVEIHQ